MLVKRIYEAADLARYQAEVARLLRDGASREHAQAVVRQPKLSHLEVRHTGTTPEQNFSSTLVAGWVQAGVAVKTDDTLVIKAAPEPLRYKVLRTPGYYCAHDGKKIPVSPEGYGDASIAAMECTEYLKANGFEGVESPDKSNPAGYLRTHAYECVLDADQHARFKAVPGALAPSQRAANQALEA
jgi:hypothetical protein